MKVYLDHAAATPVDKKVLEAMMPFFKDIYGNSSALHRDGRIAKTALFKARKLIAKIINAKPEEIIFCGSGTESDNMAVFGVSRFYKNSGSHIIVSAIEHHAVLNSASQLNHEGFKVDFVGVDRDGLINPPDILRLITPGTILISVMYANNEIGTIQPIKEIAAKIKKWKKEHNRAQASPPFFHTDACQAGPYLSLDVKKLGVDLMTLNGSKIYGPKGVGMLYKNKNIQIQPIVFGGGQEKKLRGGTENIAGIIGFTKALEISQKMRIKENKRLTALKNYFVRELLKIPRVELNGHAVKRLPNNVNVSILGIEGEAMLLYLDKFGIEASTGSACDSENLEPSHVILALSKPYEYAHGSLRFSMGRDTIKEQIDYVLKILPKIVEKLRRISPLTLDLKKPFVVCGRPHFERKFKFPKQQTYEKI